MAGIAQNGQKCLVFILVSLLRLENMDGKNKKIYSKYKKFVYNM